MYDHKLETLVSQPNRPMGRNPFRVLLVVSCPTYGQNMSLKAFNQLVRFPRKTLDRSEVVQRISSKFSGVKLIGEGFIGSDGLKSIRESFIDFD